MTNEGRFRTGCTGIICVNAGESYQLQGGEWCPPIPRTGTIWFDETAIDLRADDGSRWALRKNVWIADETPLPDPIKRWADLK